MCLHYHYDYFFYTIQWIFTVIVLRGEDSLKKCSVNLCAAMIIFYHNIPKIVIIINDNIVWYSERGSHRLTCATDIIILYFRPVLVIFLYSFLFARSRRPVCTMWLCEQYKRGYCVSVSTWRLLRRNNKCNINRQRLPLLFIVFPNK